jgi:hypothetical protein
VKYEVDVYVYDIDGNEVTVNPVHVCEEEGSLHVMFGLSEAAQGLMKKAGEGNCEVRVVVTPTL